MSLHWNDELEARRRAIEIERAKRSHPSYPYRARRRTKWRTARQEVAVFAALVVVMFAGIELAAWITR